VTETGNRPATSILKPSQFTSTLSAATNGTTINTITNSSLQSQQQQQQQQDLTVTTEQGNGDKNATSFTTATCPTPMNMNPTTPLADPSQRTDATFGTIPGNVPSVTLHTSNLKSSSLGGGFSEREADRFAAWVIHAALIFFCFLVIVGVVLSLRVIRNYGFITLVGLLVLLSFVGFLACFVDRTVLAKNPKLRPIRQKIIGVVDAARQMLAEEYHLLKRDWNEHLLLTQGEEQYFSDVGRSTVANNGIDVMTGIPPPRNPQGRKRSKVFKLVKPLLGLKKKFFRGRKQRRQQEQPTPLTGVANGNGTNLPSSMKQQQDYHPPELNDKISTGVVA